jgi:iron complex transport system substrate-binding protein
MALWSVQKTTSANRVAGASSCRAAARCLGHVIFWPILILVTFGCHRTIQTHEDIRGDTAETPQRIVSMSPSITEILFALGLGDRLVGVTDYCDYPPQAKTKAKIGGLHDPNYEAIVVLQPDLIIMRLANQDSVPKFRELDLDTLTVSHNTMEGILQSIETIGRRCGTESEGQELLAKIKAQMRKIESKTAGLERPRVLFSVDRTLGTGRIEDVYVAGRDGFISRIITLAGGRNACPETTVGFPVVSSEGIMRMNPEVILDMVDLALQQNHDAGTIVADWQQLPNVDAVKNGRVYVLDDDYAFIPGPRCVLLAEKLARLIHPEIDWEK